MRKEAKIKMGKLLPGNLPIPFNPIALRMDKTPQKFGCSECNRVNERICSYIGTEFFFKSTIMCLPVSTGTMKNH